MKKMRRIVALIIGNDPFSRSGLRELLFKLDNSSLLDVVECDPGEHDREAIAVIASNSPCSSLGNLRSRAKVSPGSHIGPTTETFSFARRPPPTASR